MATVRWLGNAAAVAQVDTATVGGTIEADDLFKLTINGKTFTFGCVQEPETESIAVDMDAMRERFTKSIHVSKLIGYTPAVGQLLTIEEKVWRVSQYTSGPAVYHLVLLSENE